MSLPYPYVVSDDGKRLDPQGVQGNLEALDRNSQSTLTFSPPRFIGATGQPSFTNSWTNYGLARTPAHFYKFGPVVFTAGAIGGGASGTTAWTMPPGYLPASAVLANALAGGPGNAYITLTTAGLFQPTRFTGTAEIYFNFFYRTDV